MQCIDGLLWIGSSYSEILCNRKADECVMGPACVTARHCFVHEAQYRGISRKIPQVPHWAVAKQTRIFLAHRGKQRSRERGELFGFFTLERVEVLRRFQRLPPLSERVLRARGLPSHSGLLTGIVYDTETGKPVPGGKTVTAATASTARKARTTTHGGSYRLVLREETYAVEATGSGYQAVSLGGVEVVAGRKRRQDLFLEPLNRRDTERTKECPDGTVIVTHRLVNGRWVRTGEKCEPDGPPGCVEGDVLISICEDGTPIVTQRCQGGEWVDTGETCPGHPDIDDEMFKEHRSCSLRLGPASVYLVDALEARISDAFSAEAELKDLKRGYSRATDSKHRLSAVEAGRALFHRVAARERGRGPKTKVPSVLKAKAVVRGELVLFEPPYPVLKRSPRAAFRSLIRIDGSSLLHEIADGKRTPAIRTCDGRKLNAS